MLSTGYYTQALMATLLSAQIPHLTDPPVCPWLLWPGPELRLLPSACSSLSTARVLPNRNQREGPCQLVESIVCVETRHVSAKELETRANRSLHLTVRLSEENYKKQQLVG